MDHLPVGTILPLKSDDSLLLPCNGHLYDRRRYPELFACLGDIQSYEDNRDSFAVPNLPGYGIACGRINKRKPLEYIDSSEMETEQLHVGFGEPLHDIQGNYVFDEFGKVVLATQDAVVPIRADVIDLVMSAQVKYRISHGLLCPRIRAAFDVDPKVYKNVLDFEETYQYRELSIRKLLELQPNILDPDRKMVCATDKAYSDTNRGFILHSQAHAESEAFSSTGLQSLKPLYDKMCTETCCGCNAHVINTLVCLPGQPSISWHIDSTLDLWEGERPVNPYAHLTTVMYLQMPLEGGCIEFYRGHHGIQSVCPGVGDMLVFDGGLMHRVVPFEGLEEEKRVTFVIEHYRISPRHRKATKAFHFETP